MVSGAQRGHEGHGDVCPLCGVGVAGGMFAETGT